VFRARESQIFAQDVDEETIGRFERDLHGIAVQSEFDKHRW
jgi:hypothetical protein